MLTIQEPQELPLNTQRSFMYSSMSSDSAKYKTCSRPAIVFALFTLVSTGFISSYNFSSFRHSTIQDLGQQLRPTTAVQSGLESNYSRPPVPSPPPISCDRSHERYDLCLINGPTVLDPAEATLYSIGPPGPIMKVKPYPRKWEGYIMGRVREVSLVSGPIGPKCEVHHDSPAIVFSAGGYTGNVYHDIDDGILPLFITVNRLSLTDRDVILVVDHIRDWWVHKYADVLRAFSKHPIINLENDTSTHCFSRAYVGLVSHGFMTIDPKARPGPLALADFHSFLRNALLRGSQPNRPPPKSKPTLAWVARPRSAGRAILNQDAALAVAEEVGFEVKIFKPSNTQTFREVFQFLDTSHAMIGVHGAAMTHLVLLRPGKPMVQVVPLGLEWAAKVCYGLPAIKSGLEYMVYDVGVEESSLLEKYGKDDPILKDPQGIRSNGWHSKGMDVYLKEQDVKLDLAKFRGFMEKVYVKAKAFMDTNG